MKKLMIAELAVLTLILVGMVIACFGIAQFGLLSLVQQGYSLLAYMAIPVVTIPYVVNFIWVKTRKGKQLAFDGAKEDA